MMGLAQDIAGDAVRERIAEVGSNCLSFVPIYKQPGANC